MVCHECGRETADGFSFCPHCGTALPAGSPVVESPTPPLELKVATEVVSEAPAPTPSVASDGRNEFGTYMFGAFALISLLVSLIKGVVPIYLMESAIWAGAAWYWHRAKTHSELGKAIVIVIAVLVAVGEVVHIASQPDLKSTAPTASDPFAAYGGHEVASSESTVASQSSQGGTQSKANSAPDDPFAKYIVNPSHGDTHDKPKPRDGTPAGLEATISCDVVAYDRDKYGDGNPRAIANLHQGETVPYVGHVTIGDEDIIRVHGRSGYVSGCVDVKMGQDATSSDPKLEPKPNKSTRGSGLEATITCDAIVWDRDKYGDGDPVAIASVHLGDTVPYVGHVTIGDQEIIRVHGRRGYVSGCVDVKQ